MQEEAERAKPLIAPSAEYHCRECLEATIDAKLERGTQTSAWWLVFGVFMAILPTVIYGIFWAPDRAQELLDNGLFFLEDTFMPVAQWFQRQRGFQEAVRFLQPVIDDLQFSFQRAGQYIQPVIEDLRLVAQRAIDHVSFENLMMLKTDIDFMLKSTALKVVDELLKFCVAIGNSYNYYFTEYCAPAFERMAFSLKYILDKFESDFVGPIADSVAPLLEVAIKNVEPAANFALSYWRSALAFIIESGVYNAFLANFQLFKSYASELLETMEFGVLNGFFESIGYVELGLIGAWFGAMGLIYVILPI